MQLRKTLQEGVKGGLQIVYFAMICEEEAWESIGSLLGVSWESLGSVLGVSWESLGSLFWESLGSPLAFSGDFLGILLGVVSQEKSLWSSFSGVISQE